MIATACLGKMSNNDHTKIKFEEWSCNVFANLGPKGTDELFTRAQPDFHVHAL
jgi:hypothetical protein